MQDIERLKYYDDLYFNYGESTISDTEYDNLKDLAKKENPNDPYFQTVGSKTKFEEIELPFILGGLDKVDSTNVIGWINKDPDTILMTEKVDGNSIGCIWENGKLTFAASKGDGYKGQNLLKKCRHFLFDTPYKKKISLRGEIVLRGNKHSNLGYKNRRNAVAGILRKDEIMPEILSQLDVIFYEIIECEENLTTEIERLRFINEVLKLQGVNYGMLPKNLNDQETINFLENLLINLKEMDEYDLDGLVLSRNSFPRENVSYPKNKVKFKVNQSAVKCTVKNIEWGVTRTGLVKPVVIIDPVEILGVTVSRASGFNATFINSNGIGPGAEVGIVRSGDVVPYVTEVFKPVKVQLIENCPDCNYPLISTSKDLICENPNCFHKKIQEVSHFFTSMGVEGMSVKTVENIGITNIIDIYRLTKDQLRIIPGFGEKKADNILKEVEKTLHVKPEQLLTAFGVPLIGRTLSKEICNKFKFDELFNIKDPEVLGLGPITSKHFIDNINNYFSLYQFLKSIGLSFIIKEQNEIPLKGLQFALTGSGPKDRKEIQKEIENLGGEVKGISKNTNYLVTNDVNSNSGKMKTAREKGIEIINYERLFNEFIKTEIYSFRVQEKKPF